MNTTDNPEFDLQKWSSFLARVVWNDPYWVQILTSTILIIIFVVGLIGNLLTCIVIYSEKTMHTATNFYLFNMAVSDTVVSFAIFMEVYLFLMDSYYGNVACKIHIFFVIVLWNNGILVMTALAIERYIAIWHPLLLKSTPAWRRVMKVIICIWIIAICESAPEVFTTQLIRTSSAPVCFTVPYSFARIVNGILALVTFIIPLGIMVFVYTMIAFKVSRSEKSNSRKKIFNHKDNRKKVNKLVGPPTLSPWLIVLCDGIIVIIEWFSVAITLSFFICWLPFFTIRILIFLFDMEKLMQYERLWSISYKLIVLNSWMSIVLNPILFSLMSTKFRQALKILWMKKFKKQERTEISSV